MNIAQVSHMAKADGTRRLDPPLDVEAAKRQNMLEREQAMRDSPGLKFDKDGNPYVACSRCDGIGHTVYRSRYVLPCEVCEGTGRERH